MSSSRQELDQLLAEYDRALGYTDSLWLDLDDDQLRWRPHENSSAIGWHLGHQAAVAHFMVRNLIAAEPPIDAALEELMDSATPEPDRGGLPSAERLAEFRSTVADRVRVRVDAVRRGEVGAPAQLVPIACGLLRAVVNHEYQHDAWIGEVRADQLGLSLPTPPSAPALTTIDGYIQLVP